MFDLDSSNDVLTLANTARRSPPAEALRELGQVLCGQPAYPAAAGVALHAPKDPAEPIPLLDLGAPGRVPAIGPGMEDVALCAFGLTLSEATTGAAPVAPRMHRACIALRLGWVLRCLDLAFGHLDGRDGFGGKLLHQPLLKAQFSEINAAAERILTELRLPGELSAAMLSAHHREISQLFTRAAKLMGGRGLLEGKSHGLEFLDAVFVAIIHATDQSATAGARGGS